MHALETGIILIESTMIFDWECRLDEKVCRREVGYHPKRLVFFHEGKLFWKLLANASSVPQSTAPPKPLTSSRYPNSTHHNQTSHSTSTSILIKQVKIYSPHHIRRQKQYPLAKWHSTALPTTQCSYPFLSHFLSAPKHSDAVNPPPLQPSNKDAVGVKFPKLDIDVGRFSEIIRQSQRLEFQTPS